MYKGIHGHISLANLNLEDKVAIVTKSDVALVMQHNIRPCIVNANLCIKFRRQNKT